MQCRYHRIGRNRCRGNWWNFDPLPWGLGGFGFEGGQDQPPLKETPHTVCHALYTVEPLNNQLGHFVHYREVVLFERQNVLPLYSTSESVLYTEVSFIQSVLYQRFHCVLPSHRTGCVDCHWITCSCEIVGVNIDG